MFAIVIILAGVIGLVRGSGPAWAAMLVGIAMLVVTEWIVWRR